MPSASLHILPNPWMCSPYLSSKMVSWVSKVSRIPASALQLSIVTRFVEYFASCRKWCDWLIWQMLDEMLQVRKAGHLQIRASTSANFRLRFIDLMHIRKVKCKLRVNHQNESIDFEVSSRQGSFRILVVLAALNCLTVMLACKNGLFISVKHFALLTQKHRNHANL